MTLLQLILARLILKTANALAALGEALLDHAANERKAGP